MRHTQVLGTAADNPNTQTAVANVAAQDGIQASRHEVYVSTHSKVGHMSHVMGLSC